MERIAVGLRLSTYYIAPILQLLPVVRRRAHQTKKTKTLDFSPFCSHNEKCPFEMHYVHCPPPTPRYIIQIRAAGLRKWATIYSANAHTPALTHLSTIFKCVLPNCRKPTFDMYSSTYVASFMHDYSTSRNFKL